VALLSTSAALRKSGTGPPTSSTRDASGAVSVGLLAVEFGASASLLTMAGEFELSGGLLIIIVRKYLNTSPDDRQVPTIASRVSARPENCGTGLVNQDNLLDEV
jgi:hypothetical protein